MEIITFVPRLFEVWHHTETFSHENISNLIWWSFWFQLQPQTSVAPNDIYLNFTLILIPNWGIDGLSDCKVQLRFNQNDLSGLAKLCVIAKLYPFRYSGVSAVQLLSLAALAFNWSHWDSQDSSCLASPGKHWIVPIQTHKPLAA